MQLAAILASLALVALVGVGVYAIDPDQENLDALGGHDNGPATNGAGDATNWTLVQLSSQRFPLDSVTGQSFDVTVPADAAMVRIDVVPNGGVYTGPASWTGLGECDGQTGASGPTVDVGVGTGAASATCVLEAGSHTVAFSLPVGIMNVLVTMTAVVPEA